MKNYFRTLLVLFMMALSFGAGIVSGEFADLYNSRNNGISGVINTDNRKIGQNEDVDFSIFWDAWQIIEDKYTLEPLDHKKMVYGAVSGMVDSLKDPYTVFLSPDENAMFNQDMKGSFGGVGTEIGFRDGFLTVIAPLKDSPAEKAGILSGDKIVKVDGKDIVGMNIDEAVLLIRGEKGTSVKLTIIREGDKDLREIDITRDIIVVNTVDWKMMDGKIAYISINQFKEDTGIEFDNKINEILSEGPKGIILDLRNNPGGYLNVSIDIASRFIDKGKTVVIQDQGNNNKEEYKAAGGKRFENIPMVVLVNEGSASASEILAGALRDDNKIKIVGKKTFGKGLVQEMEKMKDGSAIKVTIAKWLTPNGVDINHDGIHPDFEVNITEEDVKNKKDPQLDKAMELLK
ncbi:MAG: S41 family peptidase [Minisyncoccia bacterium]